MSNTKKLTDEKTWDTIWKEHPLPQTLKTSPSPQHPYYVDVLDKFFHQYLPKNENFEFLELGCAPGRWLHYFNKEFGYKVSGLDNSPIGFKMTKENLKMLGVKANLYFGDVLNYKIEKKFDVIFSEGLVEHFDPPAEILKKHLEMVNQGGYIIIGIPNFKHSLYYFLQKIINKNFLEKHLLLDKKDLAGFFNDQKPIVCQNLGVFNLYLLNLDHKPLVCKVIHYLEILIEKILRFIKIEKESAFFSPYIFIIIKKT